MKMDVDYSMKMAFIPISTTASHILKPLQFITDSEQGQNI